MNIIINMDTYNNLNKIFFCCCFSFLLKFIGPKVQLGPPQPSQLDSSDESPLKSGFKTLIWRLTNYISFFFLKRKKEKGKLFTLTSSWNDSNAESIWLCPMNTNWNIFEMVRPIKSQRCLHQNFFLGWYERWTTWIPFLRASQTAAFRFSRSTSEASE